MYNANSKLAVYELLIVVPNNQSYMVVVGCWLRWSYMAIGHNQSYMADNVANLGRRFCNQSYTSQMMNTNLQDTL